uniref:Putative plant transposon protein domain-containing protein n=1 Tax=Noccaea caerulescens TaxID=107243 RepID=A0A1J3DMF8_NOCCA
MRISRANHRFLHLLNSPLLPVASKSFNSFKKQKFNDMIILPLNKPAFASSQRILQEANGLATVREIAAYSEGIVREFYANLGSMEYQKSGHNVVFVRGYMYVFTPRIINQMFGLPNTPFLDHDDVLCVEESLVDVASLLSNKTVHQWTNLTSRDLAPDMSVIYKICFQNWLPTVNRCAMSKQRANLVFEIAK